MERDAGAAASLELVAYLECERLTQFARTGPRQRRPNVEGLIHDVQRDRSILGALLLWLVLRRGAILSPKLTAARRVGSRG